ncbi:MAG: heavy-metal-associated domain-containing protein [Oscillospiraceae bacterium]|nr:heavy-metal-associated domain-containing protein [Oscillospiraceae bacterium]
MKKVFKLDELDCANCARKMEDLIKAIDGVDFASVNFFAQKLTLEAENEIFEDVLKKAEKAVRKIEPDCRIIR